MHRGDLLTNLVALARPAPPGSTLVIYHSAVLAYVAPGRRRHFAETVTALNAASLSNKGPRRPFRIAVPGPDEDRFVLQLQN